MDYSNDQQRTRVLIDNAPEAVLIYDVAKNSWVDFNQNAIDFFKFSAEELSQRSPEHLSPATINGEDAVTLVKHYLEAALQGGNPIFDWIHIDRDGNEIPCEIRLVRFPPYEKMLVRASVTDLRPQKALEQALRESESRLKLALKTTGIGYFDWYPQSQKTHWDDRMHEILNLPKASTANRVEYFFSCLHESDRDSLKQSFGEAFNPASEINSYSRVCRFIINQELKYLQLNGFLFRDDEGQVYRIIGTTQDITERQLADEKLARAKQELSKITERFQISTKAAKVGIWDWDVKSEKLLWDETMLKLHGISEEEFKGMSTEWKTRIHPEDRQQCRDDLVAALKGEKEYNTEFRIVWPDQSVHHIKALGTVQRDEAGQAIRMIGTNWDITKEKEAERQKIRARQLALKNKELEQFAYVASHDLQEPLRTIIAFVGILKKQMANTEEESTGHLELIFQAATRMNKLINGLLDYSLIGKNKELVSINCQQMVQQILDDLTAQISESNCRFEIGELPTLKGYENELRVLFQNLISNAIKFRKPKPDLIIEISAIKTGEFWQFCIADNGIGIDQENQERIFVIFQRLHLQSQYKGTGIGLAHCQKIVDLHGGKIWVESVSGSGSSFYFTIPENIIALSS